MENNKEYKRELEKFSKDLGISLFGVACVNPIKKEFLFYDETLKNLDYTISLGLRLSDGI